MTGRRAEKIRHMISGFLAAVAFAVTLGVIAHIEKGYMAFSMGKWLVLAGVAIFAICIWISGEWRD